MISLNKVRVLFLLSVAGMFSVSTYVLASEAVASDELEQQTLGSQSEAKSIEALVGQADEISNGEFVVMSYNIQQLGYPDWFGSHFEQSRLELIPDAIRALPLRPDVLVFQEAFTDASADYLKAALLKEYPFSTLVVANECDKGWDSVEGNCTEDTVKHNGGVMILSRWPIDERHAYVYKAVRVSYTFDFMAQKGAVYAALTMMKGNFKKRIHVIGTHLQADGGSHDIRVQQLKEMKTWIDQFDIPKNEPIIMAGDFNIDMAETQKFADMLTVTNTSVEFKKTSLSSVSPSTNAYLKMIYGFATEHTLDFILYRLDHLLPKNKAQVSVVNLKSKREWQTESWLSESVKMKDLSDHYPVITSFQF